MLKIGVAGLPVGSAGTLDGIKKVKDLGLSACEIEFVRNIYMSNELAEKTGELAKSLGLDLTVHAPYYINLNSKNEEVVEASKKRISDSAERGIKMDAKSCTYHAGYRHEKDEKQAYAHFKEEIKDVMSKSIRIAPECTGKDSQFGSWDELLKLHKEINCGICFDFSHIWARERGKVDFNEVLNKIKKDYKWYKDMHMHMSGIKFGNKGELNHQMFEDTEFPWQKVASLLSEKGFGGIIICESPNAEKDALILKDYLDSLQ